MLVMIAECHNFLFDTLKPEVLRDINLDSLLWRLECAAMISNIHFCEIHGWQFEPSEVDSWLALM